METIITFRGRKITQDDIATIRKIIDRHPTKSRRFISQEVCRRWNWKQPNGSLKDMTCRSLLLLLETKGLIVQPPRKCQPANPLVQRKKPAKIVIDQSPLQGPLKNLFPIQVEQARKTPKESIFNRLIETHHYLGYTQTVGEHLKYLVYSRDRIIACLAWGSVPWHMVVRDRFIGWSPEIRRKNLHLMANNTRFLILPWISVRNLASHLLAAFRYRLSRDWERLYNHPIHLLETFVDPERFLGTCYRADNWIYVGKTTGRGKNNNSHRAVVSQKAVYLYPLTPGFRELLCRTSDLSSSPQAS